jgi:DNA mismatch endonuclease (patch repair protein)
MLRRELHARGLRYRLHAADLPGKPDVVFRRARVAVFVDGAFWHGHPERCRVPKSNRAYWVRKIERNKARDERVNRELREMGWRAVRLWDFEVRESPARCGARVEGIVRRRLGESEGSARGSERRRRIGA